MNGIGISGAADLSGQLFPDGSFVFAVEGTIRD